MSFHRFPVTLVCLLALGACQDAGLGEIGAVMTGRQPETPVEQSLAAGCTGDAAQSAVMGQAVNAARAAQGKTELDANEKLALIAQSHACDMARTGRVDVAGSNGSNVVDRARAADYRTCGVVQLVAKGGQAQDVMAGWLRSGPQRNELLGQLSLQLGSGYATGADGRGYWSVVLGNNCR